MKVIDFRARPNTPEYMASVLPSDHRFWTIWGNERPAVETLEAFCTEVRAVGISTAVFTGRQRVAEGEVVRGVTNDYIADCVEAYPDLLVGIAGVDLTAPDSGAAELERSVRELGLLGACVDPSSEATVDSQRAYRLYETAQTLNVPVVLTMGPLVEPIVDPWAVDRAAKDFPEVTFVCSHACYPQVDAFIAVAMRRPNVILEASLYEFLPGAEPFMAAAVTNLQDQVVYASAFPMNRLAVLQRFIDAIGDSAVLEKLLAANAERVLGGAVVAATDAKVAQRV